MRGLGAPGRADPKAKHPFAESTHLCPKLALYSVATFPPLGYILEEN